jgi:hypothetical protein
MGAAKRLEEASMKFGTLTFLTTVILFGVLPSLVQLAARNVSSEIITFDAPGASAVGVSFDGTFPKSINDAGAIVGHYIDANAFYHGFVRSPGGEFITLDAPGGGTSVGFRFGTFPNSINIPSTININNRGTITGNYVDSNNVSHGFLRSPGGEFSTFDAPGASSVAAFGYGTFPKSINGAAAITGHYTDVHNVISGFVRNPSGRFTTFNAPGASSVADFGYGTVPKSINAGGGYHGTLR